MRTAIITPQARTGKREMETAMRTTSNAQLSAFNQQILERQEEAYTLAYYLSGSERQAEAVLQAAVLRAYRTSDPDARVNLLRAVIAGCNRTPYHTTGLDPLTTSLLHLPRERRCAVLLVDVLGLSYAEAARVLGCPTARISQWLAQGRLAVMAV